MKTPLHKLLDFEKDISLMFDSDQRIAMAVLTYIRDNRKELIEEEKEVIVNAVKQGWDYNEEGLVQWMGETYYNETFNTKEK